MAILPLLEEMPAVFVYFAMRSKHKIISILEIFPGNFPFEISEGCLCAKQR